MAAQVDSFSSTSKRRIRSLFDSTCACHWVSGYTYVKRCTICGKSFDAFSPNAKYCPKCRARKKVDTHITKHRCEECGRQIRSGIPKDSEEKALCSFCIQKEKGRIARLKEEKKRYVRCAKPCAVCGKMAILVKHTEMCPECYFKGLYPNARVKELKE